MLLGIYTVCVWVIMTTRVCRAGTNTDTQEPRVLILGAGMSGVSVAKTLDEAGHHNFLLIEGASRIGGRIRSEKLSDHTVELGAMWVYGAGTNPVYNLLNDYNISMDLDYSDTWTVRDASGNDVTDRADEVQSRFDDAIDAYDVDAKAALANDTADFTVASRLRYHGWLPKTATEEVIEGFNCFWEKTVSPAFMSGKHAYWWEPFDAFDTGDAPIVNDERGFEALVDKLGANFTPSKVRLNEVVTHVKQNNDGVEVLTASGASYQGDIAVVTFSLGALQSQNVNFEPALPDCKREAIAGFGMGHLTQIYLQFSDVFWDNTLYLLHALNRPGQYSVWVNINDLKPGSNILQVSVWGDESRRVERMADSEIIDDILTHLRRMYPNSVVPAPLNFTISKWTHDPLTYGAYSYWPTGFTENNMADMRAPFGRVYFAGEHLDPQQFSYVHAAYDSGRKTGRDVIQCLQNTRSCSGLRNVNGFQCSKTPAMKEECETSSATARVLATPEAWPRWTALLLVMLQYWVLSN